MNVLSGMFYAFVFTDDAASSPFNTSAHSSVLFNSFSVPLFFVILSSAQLYRRKNCRAARHVIDNTMQFDAEIRGCRRRLGLF